jgi:oligopeptide transport system permease protein
MMAAFVVRRLLQGVLTLWAVASLTFVLVRTAPGGPFDREKPLPPAVLANLERAYGLHGDLFDQYLASLKSWATLDLGVTYASEGARTVAESLAAAFPVSLELGLMALALALCVGVGAGVWAALHRNTWRDHATMATALLAVSLSSLVLGPLLLVVFGVTLRWLPWGGWEPWAWEWSHLRGKILPAVTLGLVYAAYFARLARAGMLDVLQQPFVRTARAKGLPEWRIVVVHAVRGGLLPAVSFLGPALAGIVTGSVVVERVFAVPGLGEAFVAAAVNRDYPLVIGTVMLYSTLLIGCNLLVDLAYAWLDPRVRLEAP